MLHRFLAAYVRYAAHLVAYLTLAADPYPGFTGRPGSYPIDVEIDPPGRAEPLGDGLPAGARPAGDPAGRRAGGLRHHRLRAAASGLRRRRGHRRVPRLVRLPRARPACREGLRDLLVYAIGYSAQVIRLPVPPHRALPEQRPRRLRVGERLSQRPDPAARSTDDLRRSRLTVFFRLLLAIPHFVWLLLWGIAAFFAAIANWFVTLFRGTLAAAAAPLPRRRYVRYQTHVYAFLQLVANPFPGFSGKPGTYPVDVEIEPRSARTAGSRLSAVPRHSRPSWSRARSRRRCLRGRDAELVLRPLPRARAARAAQPGRVRAALLGPGVRLRLSAHRPLSVQRALGRLADELTPAPPQPAATPQGPDPVPEVARAGGRWSRLPGSWPCRCCGRPTCPTTSRCRISTRARTSSRAQLEEARDYERFTRINGVAVDRGAARRAGALRPSRRALHARVGGGADRHRHAARDAGLRVRVAGPAALRARPAVVGPPPRRLRARATWSGS